MTYGRKLSRNSNEYSDELWYQHLSKLTKEQLAHGIKKALFEYTEKEQLSKECWPPNVKEFRSFCLSLREDLRLPLTATAFLEAKNNAYCSYPQWSHPAVYWAASRIGVTKLKSGDLEAYTEFELEYEKICQYVLQGKILVLPKDPSIKNIGAETASSPDVARKHLQEMARLLGTKLNETINKG